MAELNFTPIASKTGTINRNLLLDAHTFSRFKEYRFGVYSVNWDEAGEMVKTVERNPSSGKMFAANRVDTSMALDDAVKHINTLIEAGESRPHNLILYMPSDLLCLDFDDTDSPGTDPAIHDAHYGLMEFTPTWIEKSVSGVGRHAFYRVQPSEAQQLTNTNNAHKQLDTRVVNGFVFLTGNVTRDADFAPFSALPSEFKSYLFKRCESSIEALKGSDAQWIENEARSDADVVKMLFKNYPETATFLYTRQEQTGFSDNHFSAMCDLIKCSLNYDQVKRMYTASECAEYAYRSENRQALRPAAYENWLLRNVHAAASRLTEEGRFTLSNQVAIGLDDDQPANTFNSFQMSEIVEYTPTNWIVQGVVPSKGLATIYGPSGSGKTFLTLDMLAAVSNGNDWFGRRTQRVPVTYTGLEGEAGIRNRMFAHIKEHGGEVVDMLVITEKMDLRNADDGMRLARTVRQAGYNGGIICIDTMAKSAPGMNENDSSEMSQYIKTMENLAIDTDSCVLLVHHSGKDTERGPRGHSSFLAGLDAAIQVSRENDNSRKWATKKVKDGSDDIEENFTLKSVEIGIDQWGNVDTSCVIGPGLDMDTFLAGTSIEDQECNTLRELFIAYPTARVSRAGRGTFSAYNVFKECAGFPKWSRQFTADLVEVAVDRGFLRQMDEYDDNNNLKEWIVPCT